MKGSKVSSGSMIAALNYVGYSELPPAFVQGSKKIWLNAILKVTKSDGTVSYCIADNRNGDIPWITKDFGTAAIIKKIDEIYPYTYMNQRNMPNLRSPNDCIEYLSHHGHDEDEIRELLSNVSEDGEEKAKEKAIEDKKKVKELIIKNAIKDALRLKDFYRVIQDTYSNGQEEESRDEEGD